MVSCSKSNSGNEKCKQPSGGVGMKLDAMREIKILKMQASTANKSQIFSFQGDDTLSKAHYLLKPFPQSVKEP